MMKYIEGKSVYVNVISKSGTTTETALAFRILKQFMEDKYGEEASSRIIATTDKARGTLKALAEEQGYETFVIPDDIEDASLSSHLSGCFLWRRPVSISTRS